MLQGALAFGVAAQGKGPPVAAVQGRAVKRGGGRLLSKVAAFADDPDDD